MYSSSYLFTWMLRSVFPLFNNTKKYPLHVTKKALPKGHKRQLVRSDKWSRRGEKRQMVQGRNLHTRIISSPEYTTEVTGFSHKLLSRVDNAALSSSSSQKIVLSGILFSRVHRPLFSFHRIEFFSMVLPWMVLPSYVQVLQNYAAYWVHLYTYIAERGTFPSHMEESSVARMQFLWTCKQRRVQRWISGGVRGQWEGDPYKRGYFGGELHFSWMGFLARVAKQEMNSMLNFCFT